MLTPLYQPPTFIRATLSVVDGYSNHCVKCDVRAWLQEVVYRKVFEKKCRDGNVLGIKVSRDDAK